VHGPDVSRWLPCWPDPADGRDLLIWTENESHPFQSSDSIATVLSGSTAAATFGLINSIGQLGGLAENCTIDFLNLRTHSLSASNGFVALVYVVAGGLILGSKTDNPLRAAEINGVIGNNLATGRLAFLIDFWRGIIERGFLA
jgi:hypothetical protein